jgi:hypothetical protein
MGAIFAKEEKELDLSPSTLSSTSVEDKVWLSVNEDNLFNNESFTNEKYFMLHNVTVHERAHVGSHPLPTGLRISTPDYAPRIIADTTLAPSQDAHIAGDTAMSLLAASVVTDEQQLISLHLTRVLELLPGLANSTNAYFDSTLQKRLFILRRIHLALHRERARDRLLTTSDSVPQPYDENSSSIFSPSIVSNSVPYALSSSNVQSSFPIVVRMTVRLLLSVIQNLQNSDTVSAGVLATLLDLLIELPALSLQNEPADVVEAFKTWLTNSVNIGDEKKVSLSHSNAIECLFGLAVARGSLCDILSTLCLCINQNPALPVSNTSLTLQTLTLQPFPALNISPFMKKVSDWNIDLFLSPLSRNSLLGTWSTRTPKLQHHSVNANDTSTDMDSIASDGTHLFIHGSQGICKIGTGLAGTSQGRMYASKTDFFPFERGWLCYASNALYFRSPAIAPATMLVLDPITLDIVGEVMQNGRGTRSSFDNSRLPFGPEQSPSSSSHSDISEHHASSLTRWRSPMFTEGRYLYILSVIGFFDYRFPKFAVDRYDPLQQMNHVNRVILHFKETDASSLVSPVLAPSSLAHASFYTNGQYLAAVLPPSVNHSSFHYAHSSPSYDIPCYSIRKFRLSDGSMDSNLVSDVVESFLHHSHLPTGNTQSLAISSTSPIPLAVTYDSNQNVIWCSQYPLVARFSNAGIPPKFERSSTLPHNRRGVIPTEVPSLALSNAFANHEFSSPVQPLELVRTVLATLARLSEDSMPNVSSDFTVLPQKQRWPTSTSASRISVSSPAFADSFSNSHLLIESVHHIQARQCLLAEPFCVEVSEDTFWLLYTIIKQSQDRLHFLLVNNYASVIELHKSSRPSSPNPSATTGSGSSLTDLPSVASFVRCHLDIIGSGLSILAVNLQRLIAHKMNPADVGMHAETADSYLTDTELLQNFAPTSCLLTNVRRLLRYFVVIEDVYGFPIDNLASMLENPFPESSDLSFGSLLASIQSKACQVLTVGLEVFYPSYSGQSLLLLNLLNRMDSSMERGHRRLLDSLINVLCIHKNPSFLLLPPTLEELPPYLSRDTPKATNLTPRDLENDVSPLFVSLLVPLIREAQASLHKHPSSNSILTLIQMIQKDLLLRAEEAEVRGFNTRVLRALVEFVRLVLSQSLESFSSILQSMEPSQYRPIASETVNPSNWWSMELMQEVTTSVVGSLLPTLLHALFFFSSNLLVGSSLLPSIVKLLGVVDTIHTSLPLPKADTDDASVWGWTDPSSKQSTNPALTKVVESLHPYEAGKITKSIISIPEAAFLSLIFDERCSTLDAGDTLELFEDEACHRKINTLPAVFSGNRSKWPRRRVIVPGNKVIFVFKTQTAQNPPKIASAKFASSFETATSLPQTSSSTSSPSSKKSSSTAWGFRCVVIGNMISTVQTALPWSVHLEKTLCCLGGQLAASLIRGDPISEAEQHLEATWLNHPLFDGGLILQPSSDDSLSTPLEDSSHSFLLSIVNMSEPGVAFVKHVYSFLPPTLPALESKLASVRRAERSTLSAILAHSGMVPLAQQLTSYLVQPTTPASSASLPDFMDPQGPISQCLRALAGQMKRIRDSILQRRQQSLSKSEDSEKTSYRAFAEPVVEKALFLTRDVAPSFRGVSPDMDASAIRIMTVSRLGPRLEVLTNISGAIASFVLSSGPLHTSILHALAMRKRRATHRCDGFEAMWCLLQSVRGSEMRQEVLRFLGSSMRLSASNLGFISSSSSEEQLTSIWPHSYLDHLRGCGSSLASGVRLGFEKLYYLLASIMIDPEASPSLQLLAIEPWAMKFTPSDLPFLHDSQLFHLLQRIINSARSSIDSLKEQRSKQTVSKRGSSVMHQSKSSLTPDQLLKLNAELDIKTQLLSSATAMFKLLALTCVSSGSIDVQLASSTSVTSRSVTPQSHFISVEPTPFHDAFFDLVYSQMAAAVEKVREDTKQELAGTLKSQFRADRNPFRNSELIDLLAFLHILSVSNIVKLYLSHIRFVKLLLTLLTVRSDRALRNLVFKVFRHVLPFQSTDPYMIIDIENVKKPLLKVLLDMVGTVSLWIASSPVHSPQTTSVDQSLDSFALAKQLITSTLLHNRPFERSVRKRALSRSASGKLALTLPFCPFFSPALTLPIAWDPIRSPKHSSLEYSRDARIAFISGSTPNNLESGSTSEDLHTLARRAVVIRADHSIPDAVPLCYFEVRFDSIDDPARGNPSDSISSRSPLHTTPPNSSIPSDSNSSVLLSSSDASFAIGLAPSDATLYGLPGWYNGSYGFHSADGNKYRSSKEGRGERYGRKFAETDVIGCGWNRLTGTVFFTKNGTNLGTAFKNINAATPMVPIVGIISSSSRSVSVNFGQMPFLFDTSNMVRRTSQLVKQVHSKVGTEAISLSLEVTSLLRAIMIPSHSPWRTALVASLKDNISALGPLVSSAAANSSTKSSSKDHPLSKESTATLPREPLLRESSKEVPKSENLTLTATTATSNPSNQSTTSNSTTIGPIATEVESSSSVETDQHHEGERLLPSATSPIGTTPRVSSSYEDLQDALVEAVESLKEETSGLESTTLAHCLASLSILGGDIEDLRFGGKAQANDGINADIGLILEYRTTQPYKASIAFESQRKTHQTESGRFQSTYLVAKPTHQSAFDMTPLPEIVLPTDILQEVLPTLLPVACQLFLNDHQPASVYTSLRYSLTYQRLKASCLKVLLSASMYGLSLCALDPSLMTRILEQNAAVTKEQRQVLISASSHIAPHPTGLSGGSTATSTAPQFSSTASANTNFIPYQSVQSFNYSMPLSSFPSRLHKIERLAISLSHKVFELNAQSELPKIYQELVDDDDSRAPRRSLDMHTSSNSSSQDNLSDVSAMGGLESDEDPILTIDSDSGYLADSTSASLSSKRSARRSSQVIATSKLASSSVPNDAPVELAAYGKPLRFSELKLGTPMKLCLADKSRRPGDWQEDMAHLIGEVGIVVDLDPKLQQVLIRFMVRNTGRDEDWWIPHRLLVWSINGLSHDEFFLLSSPSNLMDRAEVAPLSPEVAPPSTLASITSTFLAPFSFLSKDVPSASPSSGKIKEDRSKESKEQKEPSKEPKETKEASKDSASSKDPKDSSIDSASSLSTSAAKDNSSTTSAPATGAVPAPVHISSSREVWHATSSKMNTDSTTSFNQQSHNPSKDDTVLYLALYWEQQRCHVLIQMLFSFIFLNDPHFVASLQSVGGPLQMVHALRLVSASMGDREVLNKLLGTQSPYASFASPVAASYVGSRSVLSYPPRPIEHRLFESKLIQLMKADTFEVPTVVTHEIAAPSSSASSVATGTAQTTTLSNNSSNVTTVASSGSSSIAAAVPPLDLPPKNTENQAPTSPTGKSTGSSSSSMIEATTIFSLPPANIPFVLPEEPLKGFLTKTGKVFRRKKYWFVLTGPTLAYYKNAQPNQPLVGSIDLRLLTGIQGLEKKKKEHEFDLVSTDRTLSLQATTFEEKERWIHAISQHAQYFKLTNMPLTSDSLITAFINECLLHLKESVQSPLIIDTASLIQSASKTGSSTSSKSSSHAKEKDSPFVHPLSATGSSSQSSAAHSRADASSTSSSSSSQMSSSLTEKEKSGSTAPMPSSNVVSLNQNVPACVLVVASNIVGNSNSYVQTGNVIVVEQWLYPYAKRKMRKMIQLDWAENLLVVFDLACSTKSGLNVLRLYRDSQCVDLIASFSGHGPSSFPPLVIPRTDRFWMVFSCDSTSADTDILSPNTGLVNQKTEHGVRFQVSSYISHPPASLLVRPSFEFGMAIVDWLLSLVDPHWMRQGVKDVFSYLAAHMDGTQLFDRRLRVITQLTRLLQRWKSFSDTTPLISKIEHVVIKMFDMHAQHKRLGHQDHSLLFQKKFELALQISKVSESLVPSPPVPLKDYTKESTKEPKETKDRSDSSSKDSRDAKREDKEAKSDLSTPSVLSFPAYVAPSIGTYFYDLYSTELNYLVPPSQQATEHIPSGAVTETTTPVVLAQATNVSSATPPSSEPSHLALAQEYEKSPSSPRSVSFAMNVSVKTAEDSPSEDDRSRLTISTELVRDDSIVTGESTETAPSTTTGRNKIVRNLSEADSATEDITSPSSDVDESLTSVVSSTSTASSSKDTVPATSTISSATKRVKKHRRSESSESDKKEKVKVERDKAEKEREKAEKEREKAEKERERLEKAEKERERLERERERERDKKKRKQAAKEAQQAKEAQLRAQSKSTKTPSSSATASSSSAISTASTSTSSSASSTSSFTLSPLWSQHRENIQQCRSPWLSQLSLPSSSSSSSSSSTTATTSSSASNSASTVQSNASKVWFDHAIYTVMMLERLQNRRESPSPLPSSTASYSYNQHNDFTVDFAQEALLQARQQPVMMESPHPYPHGARVTSRVHCPKATQLLVYFDARSCTEANCDYLMFSKELIGGDDLGFFTGTSFPPSHEPHIIPGDSFVWSFLSDANGLVATKLYWGFRFTVTPVFTEDVRLELAVKCEEEFRTAANLDHQCTSLIDLQLMRFINSSVENLKISSFELNAEQSLAALLADVNGTAAAFPLLQNVPLSALCRRFCYLKHLNTCMSKLIPLVDMSLHGENWSIAWLIYQSKHLLFYDVKLDLLNTSLIASQSSLSKPVIALNRQQAALAEEAQPSTSTPASEDSTPSKPKLKSNKTSSSRSIDSSSSTPRTGTSSDKPSEQPSRSESMQSRTGMANQMSSPGEFLFLQGFRNLHNVDPVRLRHADKAWEVKFEGEGADDAGGPYRESLTQFCLDVLRPALGLFILRIKKAKLVSIKIVSYLIHRQQVLSNWQNSSF